MRILEVIESKRWKNSQTGATASIFGAVPYFGDADKAKWSIEAVGWTWRLDNGTVGLGRVPAKTREEAQTIMDNFNAYQDEMRMAWENSLK